MKIHCVGCGAEYPLGFHTFCGACGQMIDVEYDLASARLVDSDNPYVRFANLLPLKAPRPNSPPYTPLVHAVRLGRKLGLTSLYLKDETRLPTRTTKDRMAAVALAYMHERGVTSFAASSTGNSSTGFAYAIRDYPEMRLYLFTDAFFISRVQFADSAQVRHFGMRDASFVEASEFSTVYARRHGLTPEGGFFNPGRREGLKLAFLEAADQLGSRIDWYVQAVSSAMGVYGVYKGAKELTGLGRLAAPPRLLCVQQDSCAPMARAFFEGCAAIEPHHRVARPRGIAEAILRGDPTRAYPIIRRIVLESGGGFAIASEAEIRAARRVVEDLEGLSPCFSAATAVAGLARLAKTGEIARDATIVVNLTGGDRESAEPAGAVEWIHRDGAGWSAPAPRA
jgi:threonine synthase